MNEVDDIALQAMARAMAESLTEDPDKRVLVEAGFMLLWKKKEAAPLSPEAKPFRPRTLKIHPIAKPETWNVADAYIVLDYHYLAYHCSRMMLFPPGPNGPILELWMTEETRLFTLEGQAATDFWAWFTGELPMPTFTGAPDPKPVCNGVEPQDVK